jgi:trigger factor
MQITETLSEGLRREFRVVINAEALDQKLTSKLEEMRPQMHLKGFRPGKVPLSHLKRTYGKAMMGDIVNETVAETSQKAVTDRGLRPAMQPQVKLDSEMEKVLGGATDLVFNVAVDLMPDFEPAEMATMELLRPVADVADDDVNDAVKRMADQQRTYEPKGDDTAAESSDQIVMDFEGRIDGALFDGGKAENSRLVLGSASFIPGFEDQLIGAKPGDDRTVKVTFPADYNAANLAGKDAEFSVTVKEVLRPVDAVIDDELAKKVGLESLDKLQEAVRQQMALDYSRASRAHLKRAMLDALDEKHSFGLPEAMVEAEFSQIWRQVDADLKAGNIPDEDKDKSEDQLRAEFRKIAERRVRLGLVLSEIGRMNNINVTQDELNRAMVANARQYAGQEQRVMDYFRNNPEAVAQLRAPIFEDKVIDFLCTQIKIKDHKVSREDLFRDPDDLAPLMKAAS